MGKKNLNNKEKLKYSNFTNYLTTPVDALKVFQPE